jgi:phage tail-like protein
MNTTPPVAHRLLAALPAVYREADRSAGRGELQQLLAAFEASLLGPIDAPRPEGFEQCIAALPSLLSPHHEPGGFDTATRAAFLPWLASQWVAFKPFAHFEPARLARIVAGIVPMYGRRGTGSYLLALLRLCFEELSDVNLHEQLGGGVRLGSAEIGRTTLLGEHRPFTFGLTLWLQEREDGWSQHALAALEHAVRAVVDFAKPAHTSCELRLNVPGVHTHAGPQGNHPSHR